MVEKRKSPWSLQSIGGALILFGFLLCDGSLSFIGFLQSGSSLIFSGFLPITGSLSSHGFLWKSGSLSFRFSLEIWLDIFSFRRTDELSKGSHFVARNADGVNLDRQGVHTPPVFSFM